MHILAHIIQVLKHIIHLDIIRKTHYRISQYLHKAPNVISTGHEHSSLKTAGNVRLE